jgi:hypothetical protein
MPNRRRVLCRSSGACSQVINEVSPPPRATACLLGQIAARELELVRIKVALQRAEELSDDVAAAIERHV